MLLLRWSFRHLLFVLLFWSDLCIILFCGICDEKNIVNRDARPITWNLGNCKFQSCYSNQTICFAGSPSVAMRLRNVAEITSTTMHPGFRISLPDPQSQNPQNSPVIPAVLSFRIEQIHPKSERLLMEVISATFLSGRCQGAKFTERMFISPTPCAR